MSKHYDHEYEAHPAHGMLGISRVHGSPGQLFGSAVRVGQFISITLRQAERRHSLGRSWYFGNERLFEVWMTELQFANLITSLNIGDGVPCTIRSSRSGECVQHEMPPAQESAAGATRRVFKEKVDEKLGDMIRARDAIEKELAGSGVGKARAREILTTVDNFMRLFTDSAPFVMECFEKNVGAVVQEARTELAAAADAAARSAGLAAIKSVSAPELLTEGTKEAD